MNALLIIIGLFTAVSFTISLFCFVLVAKYEGIRVRTKDNQDELGVLTRRIKSLENKYYIMKREGGGGLMEKLLMQQFGSELSESDELEDEHD